MDAPIRQIPKIVHALMALACGSLVMPGYAAAAQAATTDDAPSAEIRAALPPDRAKALHDWTYSLALQAATWGYLAGGDV